MLLIGTMAIYTSQADASENIPKQWRDFRKANPALADDAEFYGASPCTDDRRIHYLTGIPQPGPELPVQGEHLVLAAGEYAFVRVEDPALLRETWSWLLRAWLPTSGRSERNAPEFERFTSVSSDGTPIGPIEIWIPLQPIANP